MCTKRVKVDCENVDEALLIAPGKVLREGGLVAFPTETVYGLGGDAKNASASEKIYAAKGRPSDNPLIVHIAEFSELEEIVKEVPDSARALADAFWPGPLTMILQKNEVIPYETTGGLDTVAVRMPSHPVARAFIKASGCMVAAPSANISGRPSPTTADHVWEDLNGRIDYVIDGGAVEIGLESTIIDLTEDIPLVLRPGYITPEEIAEVIGTVKMDPGLSGEDVTVRPKAPGMRYRHYAPKGNLMIVTGDTDNVIKEINSRAECAIADGKSVGIIATEETGALYKKGKVLVIGDRNDEDAIAHNLYGILREFDELGMEEIYSESLATPRIGQAIMNRLLKAAGHQIIEV